MIPFGSQRGLGQDLATHLLNAHDNERVEVIEVHGAIADDLHGAMTEWEAHAHALTRCRNYLYSLSINPDPAQGPLTRTQYADYINRVEEKLGLSGQPRAVVFHVKYGREHCHVVWSRIDTEKERAVPIAFDHEKLMMVTRDFARDHGLDLPRGYYQDGKGPQLSLYELHQERVTGLSKGDHKAQVTEAWQHSDNAKSFVNALAQKGYMLATGKRPYLLVDLYGGMHALPRLIDDKTVRTKDIRAFLEKDFPAESLPSAEDAKALVTTHRKAIETHRLDEQRAEEAAQLKRQQAERRRKLGQQAADLRQQQHRDRLSLTTEQRASRHSLRAAHDTDMQRIRRERDRKRPRGLAAFLGRATGIEIVRKKLYAYRDRKREQAYLTERQALRERQAQEHRDLVLRHGLQMRDLQRRLDSLARVEKRELKSLEEAFQREESTAGRGGDNRMPSLPDWLLGKGRDIDTPGRKAEAAKKARQSFEKAASRHAVSEHEGGGESEQSAGEPARPDRPKVRRYRRKRRHDRDPDRER
ncbi:relaxase/mobilization nuclease domain-containing protein [Halomonas sp. TRM85114]|uniref:relaxase/mobilization nuclease domain-containing protein n=1 Tax=Halomonas jincaotanensis TaxID=2810616 RepID=UPI001BD2BBF5|nr:relaxase/mobilization nuclease domain-containing protein [Halomonas jincaotanensis]MBS9405466.1 relaxase/mobilization nuclease domain-containing protein [Halomonas jincaotanensis]